MALLQIKNLKTIFKARPGHGEGDVQAVNGVDLDIPAGGRVGLVGESGCGKSLTMLSVMRLVLPPGQIVSGQVLLASKQGRPIDLLQINDEQMRQVRGKRIAMVFQDPLSSLNPVLTIGRQIEEVIEEHQQIRGDAAWKKVVESLDLVRIGDAARVAQSYPHELSGGMRQRAMMAMALSCRPDLLIADEPTTALDVTIQAQILALLQELQKTLGMAYILITHDLGVVAQNVDRVAVMYAGRIVEEGTTEQIFRSPRHPYTEALLQAVPTLEKKRRLRVIPGQVPDLRQLPQGCSFEERCSYRQSKCREKMPDLYSLDTDQKVRCYFPGPHPSPLPEGEGVNSN